MTANKARAVVPAGMEGTAQYGFAPARIVNGLLYIAGQIGVDADGKLGATAEEQASLAIKNLERVLTAAGCSFADMFVMNTYHVGDCTLVNEWFLPLKWDIFPAPYPAWTSMGVTSLAIPGALIEISAIAEIPGR